MVSGADASENGCRMRGGSLLGMAIRAAADDLQSVQPALHTTYRRIAQESEQNFRRIAKSGAEVGKRKKRHSWVEAFWWRPASLAGSPSWLA